MSGFGRHLNGDFNTVFVGPFLFSSAQDHQPCLSCCRGWDEKQKCPEVWTSGEQAAGADLGTVREEKRPDVLMPVTFFFPDILSGSPQAPDLPDFPVWR